MFGLITMNVNSMKVTRSVEVNSQINDMMSVLKMQMSSDIVCKDKLLPYLRNASLGNDPKFNIANPGTLNLVRIDSPGAGNEMYLRVNRDIASLPGTRLESMTVTDIVDISPSGAGNARTAFQGQLILEISKSNVIGASTVLRKLPIYLKTVPAAGVATIESCSIVSSTLSYADTQTLLSENCVAIGGQWVNGVCDMNDFKKGICDSMGGSWNGTECKNIRNVASTAASAACSPGSTYSGMSAFSTCSNVGAMAPYYYGCSIQVNFTNPNPQLAGTRLNAPTVKFPDTAQSGACYEAWRTGTTLTQELECQADGTWRPTTCTVGSDPN